MLSFGDDSHKVLGTWKLLRLTDEAQREGDSQKFECMRRALGLASAHPGTRATEVPPCKTFPDRSASADPNMKARLADLGGTVLAGSPADYGNLIAEETEKWGKVVKFSGAKAD
jgi:hypothetical protein